MAEYIWIGRNFLPHRRGQPCRLLRSYRGKHLLQFADGWRVVTVRGTFRKRTVRQQPGGNT